VPHGECSSVQVVQYEDRYVTATPEGVSLDTVLAGLGSRFGAYLIDLAIQVAVLLGVLLLASLIGRGGASGTSGGLVVAGAFSLLFVIDFVGYFVIFEMLWSGRTPGKRALGLRVVRVGGQPVGFWSSLLRNLLRVIDSLPSLYIVGSILVLVSPKNQRLGDMLGRTVVIRERRSADQFAGQAWGSTGSFGQAAPTGWGPAGEGQAWLPPELAHWDVSAVPAAELALARTFVNNRGGYTPDARFRLASELANRIWPFVAGPAGVPHPEQFLEAVLTVKAVRG
jgi:uncharacterized RDD family membrane protein YckC